jgi:hypothetical protein
MEDLRLEFEAYVRQWPDVVSKFMFGCLAYLARGKLFSFIFEDNLVITNLDAESREELTDSHEAFPFEFKGKPLGGWMQVVVADESELDDLMPYVRKSYEAALAKA